MTKYELTLEEDIMNDEYSFYINGVQVSEELAEELAKFIPEINDKFKGEIR